MIECEHKRLTKPELRKILDKIFFEFRLDLENCQGWEFKQKLTSGVLLGVKKKDFMSKNIFIKSMRPSVVYHVFIKLASGSYHLAFKTISKIEADNYINKTVKY